MHVFSNLVANLLAAVMKLWAFQAAVTKEKVAHPCYMLLTYILTTPVEAVTAGVLFCSWINEMNE